MGSGMEVGILLLYSMREGNFRPRKPHIFEPLSIGPVLNYWKFKQSCTVWPKITKVNETDDKSIPRTQNCSLQVENS